MASQTAEYVLNEENIDIMAENIYNCIISNKYSNDQALKIRLSLEAILLHWLDNTPAGAVVTLKCIRRLGRVRIDLGLKGSFIIDPLEAEENDFFSTLTGYMETTYTYTYRKGENLVRFVLPMLPVNNLLQLLIAVVLALLLGKVLTATLPAETVATLSTNYITPLFKSIIGVLSTVACFMVFFSLLSSINDMSNVTTLKNMGRIYLKQIIGSTVLYDLIAMGLGLLVFNVVSRDNDAKVSIFDKIFSLLLDIIPVNIVGAFYKGNMLQIVVLALFIGFLMLVLGDELPLLKKQIREYNRLFQYSIHIICKLTPLLIFLSFMKLSLNAAVWSVMDSWKILATCYLCYLVTFAGVLVSTCIHCKIPLTPYIRRLFPMICVGFSTGVIFPCLPEARQMFKDYKVETRLVDFALPIGIAISKRQRSIFYIILVLGLTAIFGQTISVGQLVVLLLSSLMLSYATPSVPGGALVVITLLLEQFGLPLDAVGISIPLCLVDSMPGTVMKVACTLSDVMYLHGTMNKS